MPAFGAPREIADRNAEHDLFLHADNYEAIAWGLSYPDNLSLPDVRRFAAEIRADAKRYAEALCRASKCRGGEWRNDTDEYYQEAEGRITKVKGTAAADRMYLEAMAAAHRDALAACRTYLRSGRSPAYLSFARQTSLLIATRYARIRMLQQRLGLPVSR